MRLSLLALAISLSLTTACSPTRPDPRPASVADTLDEAKQEQEVDRSVAAFDAAAAASHASPVAPPPPPSPVTLSGGAINAIDVSSAESTTILTAEQMAKVQRSNSARAYAPAAMVAPMPALPAPEPNTEKYIDHDDNPIQRVVEAPVSTFSIDVDTGSYSNVRRMLNNGTRPPADSVRAEEIINYFDFGYSAPNSSKQPFSVTTEIAAAPWNSKHKLMMVGIKGYEVPRSQMPAANVVFLIDTAVAMSS